MFIDNICEITFHFVNLCVHVWFSKITIWTQTVSRMVSNRKSAHNYQLPPTRKETEFTQIGYSNSSKFNLYRISKTRTTITTAREKSSITFWLVKYLRWSLDNLCANKFIQTSKWMNPNQKKILPNPKWRHQSGSMYCTHYIVYAMWWYDAIQCYAMYD